MARSRKNVRKKCKKKTKRRGGTKAPSILKTSSKSPFKKKTLTFNNISAEYEYKYDPTLKSMPEPINVNTKSETNIVSDDAKDWNNKSWAWYLVKFLKDHRDNTDIEFTSYENEMYNFLKHKFSKRTIRKNPAAAKLYIQMKNYQENIFRKKMLQNSNTDLGF